MDIQITEKKTNLFFKRDEVYGTISFEKQTPSRKELQEKLSSSLKVKPELVSVRKIDNIFGDRKSKFVAFAYENQEALDKVEPAQYKKRNKTADKEEDTKEEKQQESSEKKDAEVKEAETKAEPKEEADTKEEKQQESSEKKDAEVKEAETKAEPKEEADTKEDTSVKKETPEKVKENPKEN